ncbi:unnamed protein product [Brachionus calyciflorus]|uniref:Tc1-like transposase DDE domain-containing protein n=1 Tax=Brachionus calyciflorus TaxID=104777 RepID=A0A814EAM6_9BILA|nr:unnamed protein product [Brachionus calyciflorus]
MAAALTDTQPRKIITECEKDFSAETEAKLPAYSTSRKICQYNRINPYEKYVIPVNLSFDLHHGLILKNNKDNFDSESDNKVGIMQRRPGYVIMEEQINQSDEGYWKYNQDFIIQRTKQRSGSIWIWCCMSYYGLDIDCIFDGRLNSTRYIQILNENLIESMEKIHQDQLFIFQQDNAPCHKAKIIIKWFTDKKIECLKLRANSPDFNCIENLWSWLDRGLSKVGQRSLD